MNYELAKELKDAGFPQELGMGSDYYINGATDNRHYKQNTDPAVNDVKVPTLSELIEACGEEFHSLHRFKEGWQCRKPSEGWGNDYEVQSSGTTPEEAVARLYLALNKK